MPGIWRAAGILRKGFRLIDRVSEYERANIAAYYYMATGELDKAIDAYRLGIRNYPRDWGFHNNLSVHLHRPGAIRRGAQGGPGSGSVAAERRTSLSASIGRLHVPGSA